MPALKTVESPAALLKQACAQYPQHARHPAAVVKIDAQILYIFPAGESTDNHPTDNYPISTSRFGIGQREGSYQTPLGVHCVREKIGADADFAEIFQARKRTHTIAAIESGKTATGRDHITSRILWLGGLEERLNKGARVDSYARYIYIHGTHEEGLIGQPASAGCIRMKNRNVIDIFEHLQISSLVVIGR